MDEQEQVEPAPVSVEQDTSVAEGDKVLVRCPDGSEVECTVLRAWSASVVRVQYVDADGVEHTIDNVSLDGGDERIKHVLVSKV